MYRLEEYLAGRWFLFEHFPKEPTPRGSPLRSAGTGESYDTDMCDEEEECLVD